MTLPESARTLIETDALAHLSEHKKVNNSVATAAQRSQLKATPKAPLAWQRTW